MKKKQLLELTRRFEQCFAQRNKRRQPSGHHKFRRKPKYVGSNGNITLTVDKADPSVSVTGGTFELDGNPHPATATATGIGGADVSGTFQFT